jgi:GNAT superfamily N-acetyltransferase
MIKYRKLSRAEIRYLHHIDRTETIEHVYYERAGKLVLENEHVDVPDWSHTGKEDRIEKLQVVYDKGATFFGAFDEDELAGMSVLDHNFLQTGDRRLNLEGLWVSSNYRGKGIGRALFQLAGKEAQRRGAKVMYVSATPSENTVHFYQNLGCTGANPVDPILFAKEPEDIHLEFVFEG